MIPWSDMTPRERDVEVAKALGYTIYHYDKDYRENCYYMLMDPGFSPVVAGRMGERKTEAEAWDDAPLFSTDIAAAWQVVERMTDHGYEDWCTFEMRRSTDWHDPTWGYDVRFGRQYDPTHQRELRAWARTAPEAICLAALKARGVEV